MSTLGSKIQKAVSEYKKDPENKWKSAEKIVADYKRIMDEVTFAHEAELKQRLGFFYGCYKFIYRVLCRVKRFIKNMNGCLVRVTIAINRH